MLVLLRKACGCERRVHTVLHHNLEELDDDLGGRPALDLAEATLLSVADALQRIVENTDSHHVL